MNGQRLDLFRDALADYLPQSAIEGVSAFFAENDISLKITKPRFSKLGDYACPQKSTGFRHRITINRDLDRYGFLWVLLHEMAHYRNFVRFGGKPKPHGIEWQKFHSDFILEYLHAFPEELQDSISLFARNLPLKKSLDQEIMLCFKARTQGSPAKHPVTLNDLKPNDIFRLRGKTYQVLEKRRTRFKCLRLDSKMLYLVSGNAEVEPKSL